ncbi:MAG: anthranilate phosphoribosyltransferase [Kofleriaceae bacterium]
MKLLLIDNYDSFTWNLAQYFGELGAEVTVERNDAITVEAIAIRAPEAIVISPGPCTPNEAGISMDVIRKFAGTLPILGVCLGHQCIGQVFGGRIVRAPRVMHGKTSKMFHDEKGLYAGVENPFVATRYHSLVIAPESMPDTLEVTAKTWEDEIMGVGARASRPATRGRPVPPGGDHDHGRQVLARKLSAARARPRAGVGRVTVAIVRAIARALDGHDLSRADMAEVIGHIMDGAATPAQIGGLLIALRAKGESIDELVGAASAMRSRATPLACPRIEHSIDTCGTGGDSSGSFNVSTVAAILIAACGGIVAKHGNRAQSSRCGSADLLEALGVAIDCEPAVVTRSIEVAGIGFAFAPRFHAATRHAAAPRRELGTRTIFNFLGPLTNPAGVQHQLVGVYDRAWCSPSRMRWARSACAARRSFTAPEASTSSRCVATPMSRCSTTAPDQLHAGACAVRVRRARSRGPRRWRRRAQRGDPSRPARRSPGRPGRALRGGAASRRDDRGARARAARARPAGSRPVARSDDPRSYGRGRRRRAAHAPQVARGQPDAGGHRSHAARRAHGRRPAIRGGRRVTILDTILAAKRVEVATARAARPIGEIEALAIHAGPVRGLRSALARPPGAPVRVLAEIKRASPSAGAIRANADPAEIAADYATGGAAAISVLTDREFFAGELGFLARCLERVTLPLLRKDYSSDAYQIAEARAAGADAILLIVAALSAAQLVELLTVAAVYELDALDDRHPTGDAAVALAAGVTLLGVNHRDLKTFHIDMSLTSLVAPLVPPGVVLVAESGIRTAADVMLLGSVGAHAVLVGEQLMRAPSPGQALRELLA